jgi:UDPglucose 6-dehydrogenase
MSLVSAEIAKISLNAYVTMKISFTNTLAALCEKIPYAEIDSITKAIGSDKRISPYYIKAGAPFGGPCFPRDNRAFTAFAKHYCIDAKLAKSTDEVNQNHIKLITQKIFRAIPKNTLQTKVAILGLAYKPQTPVIEESPSIKIIEALLKRKYKHIIVYDATALDATKNYFGNQIAYAHSIKECFKYATVCIITTPDKEFKKINESYIIHKPTTIIDIWRIMAQNRIKTNINYIPVGRFTERT